MRISFKFLCTLVVPVLLADAYPHLDRRMQDRNLNIQFHQTWGANTRSEVLYQVELEERPREEGVTDDFVSYNVVGGWTSDSDTRVIATIAPTKDIWDMMVLNGGPEDRIIAGGYDEEEPKRWWIFSREIRRMKMIE